MRCLRMWTRAVRAGVRTGSYNQYGNYQRRSPLAGPALVVSAACAAVALQTRDEPRAHGFVGVIGRKDTPQVNRF
jgi:hypothetical protein